MRWILLLPIVLACVDHGSDRTPLPATPGVPEPSAIAIANERAIATVATPRAVEADSAFPAPVVPEPPQDSLRFDAAGHPLLPWIVRSACQGEDCTTQFEGLACSATVLHAEPVEASPVVATVAEGEMVQVVRRDLHVNRAGIIVVKRDHVLDHDYSDEDDLVPRTDTLHFARGDTVYALHYLALGRWVWAYHARIYDSNEFWGAATHDMGANSSDSSVAIARSQPQREDWWLVATRAGVVGWWSNTAHWELHGTFQMQHWGDDCAQIRKRVLESDERH
ncbi:MAG TPA: hypothetical protein VFI52_01490 [Gemmatimonadaceae bacterium]|nr:hypothetical protein [Gemmatimonadaceae bacterium]